MDTVRRFNRFYTRRIGVLNEGHLASPFSLAEVRVMYELAHRATPTASELARDLALDTGYLSRILRRFERRGLLVRRPSPADGRRTLLALSAEGLSAFGTLDARAHDDVAAMLHALPATEQRRVLGAMRTIERTLGAPHDGAAPTPYRIRPHQPGDMGWVVHRHDALYAREYGWDEQFEALVAEIAAKFLRRFDPERERCWIAEQDDEIVGSVFLVEPEARGLGIGNRLVDECIRFAREAGYWKVVLWTNDVLHSARRIYEAAGFRLVREGPHHSFGHDLVEQTWELVL
ncbi:MAG: bifunctional helix-turn-helix transcriptional regulator/GNAT family N-acetyltransferase [Gemmatimonadaceae bacterium]